MNPDDVRQQFGQGAVKALDFMTDEVIETLTGLWPTLDRVMRVVMEAGMPMGDAIIFLQGMVLSAGLDAEKKLQNES